MRGRPKPLSDYVGASNFLFTAFAVISLRYSWSFRILLLNMQSYKEYLGWQSVML